MASDQSVPLSKALERFSDPSDWHELRSLEPHATAMLVLDGGGGVDDHLHGHYHYILMDFTKGGIGRTTDLHHT